MAREERDWKGLKVVQARWEGKPTTCYHLKGISFMDEGDQRRASCARVGFLERKNNLISQRGEKKSVDPAKLGWGGKEDRASQTSLAEGRGGVNTEREGGSSG